MAEPLPVVEEGGEIGHGHDEEGGHVHRHHLAQDHAPQLELDHHPPTDVIIPARSQKNIQPLQDKN